MTIKETEWHDLPRVTSGSRDWHINHGQCLTAIGLGASLQTWIPTLCLLSCTWTYLNMEVYQGTSYDTSTRTRRATTFEGLSLPHHSSFSATSINFFQHIKRLDLRHYEDGHSVIGEKAISFPIDCFRAAQTDLGKRTCSHISIIPANYYYFFIQL